MRRIARLAFHWLDLRSLFRRSRHSLQTRVLVFAILFGLVPLLVSSFINYSRTDRTLREAALLNLETLASAKEARIENYLHDVHKKTIMLAALQEVEDGFWSGRTVAGLAEQVEKTGCLDLLLVNRQGVIVSAVKNQRLQGKALGESLERSTPLGRSYEQALYLGEVSNSGFSLESGYAEPVMLASAPVRRNGVLVGVLILVEGSQEFSAVVNDPTGLGMTGETLVAVRSVNELALVAPPRLHPEAWFTLRVTVGSAQMKPLQEAVAGSGGGAEMIDYRQQETLAAWRHVPSLDGGLVVKIDAEEALKTVREQRRFFVILLSLAGLCSLLGAFALAKTISRPVISLTHMVKRMAQELRNPGFEIPASTRPDEVGTLARAFAAMAYELRSSFGALQQANQTLEERVEAGTADLRKAKGEIERLLGEAMGENARISSELNVTRRVQRILLPDDRELAKTPGYDISALMEPASEVGGDFYDVIRDGERLLVAIGDVTGHGLESGVISIMSQTALRTLVASGELDPKRMLEILNTVLGANSRRMKCDRNMTFSLLEFEGGEVRITGQHEEVLVARAGGGIERHDTLDLGFALGLVDDVSSFLSTASVRMEVGDITVLYTDGITEAENAEGLRYGVERLMACVEQNQDQKSADLLQTVLWDWEGHVGSQAMMDDITLVVIRRLAPVSGLGSLAQAVGGPAARSGEPFAKA